MREPRPCDLSAGQPACTGRKVAEIWRVASLSLQIEFSLRYSIFIFLHFIIIFFGCLDILVLHAAPRDRTITWLTPTVTQLHLPNMEHCMHLLLSTRSHLHSHSSHSLDSSRPTLMAITKVSPFYEPGAPPPPVPLLTSQAEFCYEPTNAITITAQEEIPSGPTAATRQKVFQSLPRARFRSPVLHREASPGPSRNYDNLSDLSDLSELESSSESESSVNSKEGMIPKPEGESGRLNRGGYNLQDALGWNSRQFKKVKVR